MSQYFTDFSEYATGGLPSDWTEHLGGGDGVYTILNDGSANYMELDNPSNGWRFIVWDKPEDHADIELYSEFEFESGTTFGDCRLATRFDPTKNASSGDRHHYIQGYRPGSGVYGHEKYVNGSYSSILRWGEPFTPAAGTRYCQRIRINGTNMYAKLWEKSAGEPSSWGPTPTDSSISFSGRAGHSCYDAGIARFYDFGVGTAGDSAPTAPVSDPAVSIPTQDMPSVHVLESFTASYDSPAVSLSPDDSSHSSTIGSTSVTNINYVLPSQNELSHIHALNVSSIAEAVVLPNPDDLQLLHQASSTQISSGTSSNVYFTEFSEYSTGSAPSGWTEFMGSTFAFTVRNDGAENYLEIDNPSDDWKFLVWDNVPDSSDVEIYSEFEFESSPANGDARLLARMDRNQNSVQGDRHTYIQGVRPDFGNYGNEKYVNGSYGSILVHGIPYTISSGTRYCQRVRVNGSDMQVKTWEKGAGEPSSWGVVTTDSDISSAGAVGFHSYDAGLVRHYKFSVAINGETAPSSQPSDATVLYPDSSTYEHRTEQVIISGFALEIEDLTIAHNLDSSLIGDAVLLGVNDITHSSTIENVGGHDITDFGGYARGQKPDDWTTWQENTQGVFTVRRENGRNYLEISKEADSDEAITWDRIPPTADVEIYSEFEIESGAVGDSRIIARFDPDMNSSANNLQHYNCGVRQEIEIHGFSKYINGSWSTIRRFGLPFSLSVGVRYAQRIRLSGSQMNSKVWIKEDGEPDEFQLSTSDGDLSTGLVGFHSYDLGTVRQYFFSVATGGAVAKKTRSTPRILASQITHGHVTESPSLEGNFYTISPTDAENAHLLEENSLGSSYQASPNDISHGASIDQSLVLESFLIAPRKKNHSHNIDQSAIGESLYGIVQQDSSQLQTIETSNIEFHTVHSPTDLSHIHSTSGQPTGVNYSLGVEGVYQGHSIGQSLVAKFLLTNDLSSISTIEQTNFDLIYPIKLDDILSDHSITPTGFGTTFFINPEDVDQNGQLDWTRINQYHSVHAPAKISQSHGLEDIFLGSVYKITPNNMSSGSSIDSTSASAPTYSIEPEDTELNHSISEIGLNLFYDVVVSDATAGHGIESSNILGEYSVSPNGTLINHRTGQSGLDVFFDLGATEDMSHLHQVGQSDLLSNYVITAEDLLQSNNIEPSSLTPHYNSVPDSLNHNRNLQTMILIVPGEVDNMETRVEEMYDIELSEKRSYNIQVQSKPQYNIKLKEEEV